MAASCVTAYFASLPIEIIAMMCKLVYSQAELFNLIRVSRYFHGIATRLLYTSMTINDTPFPHRFRTNLAAFDANTDRLFWVRRLNLRYSLNYNSAVCGANQHLIASILLRLPNLEKLDIKSPW
jgi:hypothetical protein